jgi:hypothetical protein
MNHYSEGAEAHTRVRETRGGYGHRFVDTLIRRTVIEYESDLRITARFDHGREQVREYAAGAVNAGIPSRKFAAWLSDTVEWYVFDVEVRSGITAGHCTAADVELKQVESFVAVNGDEAEGERFCAFLRKHLAREESRSLTAENITIDLGLESLPFRSNVEALVALVDRGRAADTAIALATDLWSRFVDGLEHRENVFRTATYVDETYIAVLARLLAANVLERRALLSDDAALEDILRGEHFAARYRLQNVVEDDYFGWLLRAPYLASSCTSPAICSGISLPTILAARRRRSLWTANVSACQAQSAEALGTGVDACVARQRCCCSLPRPAARRRRAAACGHVLRFRLDRGRSSEGSAEAES